MSRAITFVFGLMLVPAAVCAQTNSAESQTVQAVLAEVRQIRQDLEASTAATQRTQILLFRLQTEQIAAGQATQRLDNARAKLVQAQSNRKRREEDVKRVEEYLREHEDENIPDRAAMQEYVAKAKAEVVSSSEEEQQWQSLETEAEEQLRIEQEKLGRLQDRLDRLEQGLESPPPRPAKSP